MIDNLHHVIVTVIKEDCNPKNLTTHHNQTKLQL